MSNSGTSGGSKKNNFSNYNFSNVDENTFKNEKFPELEDPAYPNQLIQKLKAAADAANQKQEGQHAVPAGELTRKGHYQYRGPAYVHKHDGRGRYHQWPFDYLFDGCDGATKKAMLEMVDTLAEEHPVWAIVKDSSKWNECFKFPEPGGFPGKEKRFFLTKKLARKTNAEQYFFFTSAKPYGWVSHHLIPIEAFSTKKKLEVSFTDQELELIKASGYDVNNGHNIVPLPTNDVPPHCLLVHHGNHPEYLKDASIQLQELKDKVTEAIESGKPHAGFYPDLIKRLTKAEDDLWDMLKKVGKDSVRLYLQGKQLKSNLVKYITKRKIKSTGRFRHFPEGAMN